MTGISEGLLLRMARAAYEVDQSGDQLRIYGISDADWADVVEAREHVPYLAMVRAAVEVMERAMAQESAT